MTAALSNNQQPKTNDPTRSALNRRLHACAARIAAATGQDAGDVKADFVASVTRETRLAGRATTHSSELADDELRRVVYRISTAADRCGDGRPATSNPAKPDAPGRDRAARGLPGLRTTKQVQIIEQLGARLGCSQEVVSGALKRVPSSWAASALIEEWKSRLVREAHLVERCRGLLTAEAVGALSTREVDVVRQVGDADGRARNRLPVGAVLWVYDIMKGM